MDKYIGYGFRGFCNDGSVIVGVVKDVISVNNRTLMVIRKVDDTDKSFYMDTITGGYSFTLCNGQPVLLGC